MNSFAQENAEAQGLQPDQVKLAAGRAEKLPLPDNSFDVAVCTLVRSTSQLPGCLVISKSAAMFSWEALRLVQHHLLHVCWLMQL